MRQFFRIAPVVIVLLLGGCGDPIALSPDAVLPDGSVYTGDIKDGKFHGQGRLEYPDGDHYEGQFHEGLIQGKGVYVYDDGSRYEGEFLAGRYHGNGKYDRNEGGSYEGEFQNGLYHGQGKYTSGKRVYEGSFKEGVLSGHGSYTDFQGNTYVGDVADWVANGKGTLTDSEGNVITGQFTDGSVEGVAEMQWTDGSHYKGEFGYTWPDGQGKKTNADGSVYEGEFSYGQYHGTGTLTKVASDGESAQVLKGKWRSGKLIQDHTAGTHIADQAELALEHHQRLLHKQIEDLASGVTGTPEVYFLGIAGDGTQSVFRRELEFVDALIKQRYGYADKSLLLINHHDSAQRYPMATNRSIQSAISAISAKMNKDEDVLFVYMSSHGSKDFRFSLKHDSIDLPDLSAKKFANLVSESGIKWKVLIVSACYSGGFIPLLKDDHTLVMTAADSDSQSFGCSEESEMTYFGKALFKEVLTPEPAMPLTEAFAKAQQLISEWEQDEELTPSNPKMSAPAKAVKKLTSLAKVKGQ